MREGEAVEGRLEGEEDGVGSEGLRGRFFVGVGEGSSSTWRGEVGGVMKSEEGKAGVKEGEREGTSCGRDGSSEGKAVSY